MLTGVRNLLFMTFILVCILGFSNVQVNAQDQVISQVKAALNTGSSKELVKHLDKNSDLDFEGDKSTYSKTQAEEVLKGFFQEFPPSSFQIVHQGASRAGSPYVIGEYTHKSGTFRVWIRLKEEPESRFLVHAISFYKD